MSKRNGGQLEKTIEEKILAALGKMEILRLRSNQRQYGVAKYTRI
jgi:hypothetical protein